MQFHRDEKLICWYPEGTLGRAEVLDYYRALGACEWGNRADRFCDFSLVTAFSMDYSVLRELSEFRRQYLDDHTGMKLVMLSTTPLGLGMAHMYKSLMDDWDMAITVTRELDDAANELGVDASLLASPA